MTDRGKSRVAVIGAGVSGVLTAIHLLWRARPGERVYLVEKRGQLGPGVAYATRHASHLVNVRAENMSAFADEPMHFARWVEQLPADERRAAGERTLAGFFARRGVYGRYIQDQLGATISRLGGAQHLYIVDDAATALRRTADGLSLETQIGRSFQVDSAVLAVGNFPPAAATLPGYVGDPWDPAATQGLDLDKPVLLVGTGLTMVDVVLALLDEGFAGPIYALSRRGLLPLGHAPSSPWDGLRIGPEDRRSLLALSRAVRREVARAGAEAVGWRSVVDAIRPLLPELWQGLDAADRRRFLRHLRPLWEVHRHRAAPPVAAAIEAARQRGQLRILRGRLEDVAAERGRLEVRWRPRRGERSEMVEVQRVIDCTGPGTDYSRLDEPLIRQLLADGAARPDANRLGLEVSPQGALIGGEGRPSPVLFGAGPVTRGTFWEIVSVPDIRAQAEQVAEAALAAARLAAGARVAA